MSNEQMSNEDRNFRKNIFNHCKINKRTLGLEPKTKPDSLIIKWQWTDWNIDSNFISIKRPKFNMKSRALKCQDWIWI